MSKTHVELGRRKLSPNEHEWLRECHVRGIPYIEVKRRKKSGDLHWDCISIDPALDGAVFGNEKLDAYIDGVFFAVADASSSYEHSGFVGWFRDIPVEHIDQAARALYLGIEGEIERHKEAKSA